MLQGDGDPLPSLLGNGLRRQIFAGRSSCRVLPHACDQHRATLSTDETADRQQRPKAAADLPGAALTAPDRDASNNMNPKKATHTAENTISPFFMTTYLWSSDAEAITSLRTGIGLRMQPNGGYFTYPSSLRTAVKNSTCSSMYFRVSSGPR